MVALISKVTMRSKLSEPESIEFIEKLIISDPKISQFAIAKLLCKKYFFIAPNGTFQLSGCQVVLNNLEKQGLISLPKAHAFQGKFTPMVLSDKEYPLPENFPSSVHEIKDDLKIILIESADGESKQVFNDLIGKEHPCRDSKLVGYQVKYLVKYKDFNIAAACFSSCAFNLGARDTWMEWTKEQKTQYRSKVVCMSRFLIRNKINCANLASHLLSKLVKLIKVDFENRYKISPWVLESFVDTEEYIGTCYKAANWKCIGQSKGRGRNDTSHENQKSIKDVYVYTLEDSFRELGGFNLKVAVAAEEAAEEAEEEEVEVKISLPMSIEEGLSSSEWAEHEFGGNAIRDVRLRDRIIKIAKDKGEDPFASYAKVANGVRTDITQYYRILRNKSKKLTIESLMAKHKENTICRMAGFDEVLSLHDSSSINYGTLKKTKGLGKIGKNKNSEGTLGLLTHTRLACTLDGIPLGILGSPCLAPEIHKEETRHRDDIPIEEKLSYRWVQGYEDDIKVGKKLPTTRIITLFDREGDIFEVHSIADLNREKNPVIIRSNHNRKLLGTDLRLHDFMAKEPVSFTEEVTIPPQRSREESRDKEARPYTKARLATLVVTYKKVTILPPEDNKFLKYHKPIEMYAVYAREENPPEGSERIEWMLLTTLEVTTDKMALKCIGCYKRRWKIEEFFRVLKSGCGVENHKLNDAKKLERIIAITMIISWRVMLLTMLGRKCPNLPANCMFSDDEILVMKLDSQKKK